MKGGDPASRWDGAPCGLLTLALDGTIVEANRTFAEWTGTEPDRIPGRRLQDMLKVGDRIYWETHLAPMLAMHGAAHEIAVDVDTPGGERVPMLLNAAAYDDAVQVALFRATDRRSYERELLAAKRRAEESEAAARRLAATVQSSLIPPVDPVIRGLQVGAAYRPAGAGDVIGGDFYDAFQVEPDRWMVVIGDVVGKGVEAATLTGYARYTVRGASIEARRPGEVLGALNAAFLLDHPGATCTVLAVRISLAAGAPHMVVAAGGHPLPLYCSAAGTVASLGSPGTLIGAFPDPAFPEAAVQPAPGEALVLLTDGVTEARRDGDFYGAERVRRFVLEQGWADAAALASGLADEVVGFQRGAPRDDIAVVVLRYPE